MIVKKRFFRPSIERISNRGFVSRPSKQWHRQGLGIRLIVPFKWTLLLCRPLSKCHFIQFWWYQYSTIPWQIRSELLTPKSTITTVRTFHNYHFLESINDTHSLKLRESWHKSAWANNAYLRIVFSAKIGVGWSIFILVATTQTHNLEITQGFFVLTICQLWCKPDFNFFYTILLSVGHPHVKIQSKKTHFTHIENRKWNMQFWNMKVNGSVSIISNHRCARSACEGEGKF